MSFYFAGYYFDKYKQFLECNHKDYSFKVDLRYGQLYLTRKLFSLPGRYLPINLEVMTCRTLRMFLDLIIGGWGNDWERQH